MSLLKNFPSFFFPKIEMCDKLKCVGGNKKNLFNFFACNSFSQNIFRLLIRETIVIFFLLGKWLRYFEINLLNFCCWCLVFLVDFGLKAIQQVYFWFFFFCRLCSKHTTRSRTKEHVRLSFALARFFFFDTIKQQGGQG